MTLDPSARQLGAEVPIQSREPFNSGALSSAEKDLREAALGQPHIEAQFASNPALQADRPTGQRAHLLPKASLMFKDRSDFIHHMLELETRGRISQKAIN